MDGHQYFRRCRYYSHLNCVVPGALRNVPVVNVIDCDLTLQHQTEMVVVGIVKCGKSVNDRRAFGPTLFLRLTGVSEVVDHRHSHNDRCWSYPYPRPSPYEAYRDLEVLSIQLSQQ